MAGIRLSQVAPWNRRLTNPYRTRYAQHDGRYFKVSADSLNDVWMVYEIDHDGDILKQDPATSFVAIAFTLAQARLAIELRAAGRTEDEISRAISDAPRPGTGRNHPRNVALRQGFMRPGRHL
jgi:hypothetical protein